MPAGARRTGRFGREDDGSVTVLGMFIFLSVLIIAGLALDVSNAYRVRTQLQVAGDAAAHAALVAREFNDRAGAISVALEIADANLPGAKSEGALRADDIVFGHWDRASEGFKPDPNATGAVLVNTGRSQDRHNSVSTYLLRFAGVNALDVRRQTVFETYRPNCFREGVVGENTVTATIASVKGSSLCIHSNSLVSIQTASVDTGEPDKVGDDGTDDAEMDDGFDDEERLIPPVANTGVRLLLAPSDGVDAADMLAEAQSRGTFMIRILARVNDIIAGVRDPNSIYFRGYIDSNVSVSLNPGVDLDTTAFTPGRLHTLACSSSEDHANILAGTSLSNIVLWTNCRLLFGENVALENAVIVNENTSPTSFYGPAGIRLGRDDQCGEGGGAQLVTKGGIAFTQQLKIYGGQMIAAGDISFTADEAGLAGVSIISGGMISGSTGSEMIVCAGLGMEDNFEADYFRLAF